MLTCATHNPGYSKNQDTTAHVKRKSLSIPAMWSSYTMCAIISVSKTVKVQIKPGTMTLQGTLFEVRINSLAIERQTLVPRTQETSFTL